MNQREQFLVRATRGLFLAAAVMWLVVAGLVGSGVVSIGDVPPVVTLGLAGLMAAAAAVLAFLGLRCLRGNPLVDGMALAAAVVNVLLTFTDQVGAADLAYLVFSLMLLGTLSAAWIIQRKARQGNRTGIQAR